MVAWENDLGSGECSRSERQRKASVGVVAGPVLRGEAVAPVGSPELPLFSAPAVPAATAAAAGMLREGQADRAVSARCCAGSG